MNKAQKLFDRDAKAIGDVLKLRFYPLVIDRGQGSKVYDLDGKEYIDFNASWAVVNTGYCHPKIVQAIEEQAKKLTFSSLTSAMSESSVELAERLIQLLPGDFEKKVWFGHSGSDANECIAKVVPLAKKRPRLISFVGSYHGQTLGSYSLSGHPALSRFIVGGNVTKVPFPYCYRCPYEKDRATCDLFCLRFIEDYLLKTVCPADQVAGMIIEPIQSDGGDVVPPEGFLQGLQQICWKYGVYLIIDEVKVGFGRTGKFFGFENWNITPDAIILGKPIASGLPLSAVIARKEILDCATGIHLFTTAGNPMACAVGLKTLEVLQEEKMVENSVVMGKYLLDSLRELQKEFAVIGDVRGKGLIIGIELVKDRQTKEPATEFTSLVAYRAFELGLLLYYTGINSNVLEITPCLTLTREEVDKGVKIIRQAIEDVLNNRISMEKISQFAGWACT